MTIENEKLLEKAKKISGLKNDDDIISKALELFVDKYQQIVIKHDVSAYELSKDLAGSINGPADLATNKKYLKGFGVE